MCPFLWGKSPGAQWLYHMLSVCLVFEETVKPFSRVVVPFAIQNMRDPFLCMDSILYCHNLKLLPIPIDVETSG